MYVLSCEVSVECKAVRVSHVSFVVFVSMKVSHVCLQVTSPDVLYRDWNELRAGSHIHTLMSQAGQSAQLVTVLDGHPASLAWMGYVKCG